jgi:mRNA interferase RelE/StbE
VITSKGAKKSLKKMGMPRSGDIERWIEKNLDDCENPRFKGKPLKGDYKDQWRYDVGGGYRVIVDIDDKNRLIEVTKVGHRREVYKAWVLFLMR